MPFLAAESGMREVPLACAEGTTRRFDQDFLQEAGRWGANLDHDLADVHLPPDEDLHLTQVVPKGC
jgi:hypothetical protein